MSGGSITEGGGLRTPEPGGAFPMGETEQAAKTFAPPLRLPPATKQERPDHLPLSVAQKLWVHIDKVPLQEQWLPILWRLEGELHLPAFIRAYKSVITRHEILRTRYLPHEGGYRQEVMPEDQISLNAMDVTDTPEEFRELEIWKRLRPMCLKRTPLDRGAVRLELFKIAKDNYLLGGFIHHIAVDGISYWKFIRELMEIYYGSLLGRPMPDAPRLQYADYALWENRWLDGAQQKVAETYWDQALAEAQPLALPGGRAPGESPSPRNVEPFVFPAPLSQAAQAFASKQGVTLNILFMCVVSILISRWCKQTGILLGTFCHGRPAGFETVMGCFMQLRPFFLEFKDDPIVADLLRRARQVAAAASDIRKPAPLGLLQRLSVGGVLVNYTVSRPQSQKEVNDRSKALYAALNVGDPSDSAPLQGTRPTRQSGPLRGRSSTSKLSALRSGTSLVRTQAVPPLVVNGPPEQSPKVLGVSSNMTRLPKRLQTEFSHDLHFSVTQAPSGLRGQITYASDRFEGERIRAFATDLLCLTQAIIESPDSRISVLAPAVGRCADRLLGSQTTQKISAREPK